jgi:hypothetical protein
LPPAIAARVVGLTEAEACERLLRYGPNAMEAEVPDVWRQVLRRQFRSDLPRPVVMPADRLAMI